MRYQAFHGAIQIRGFKNDADEGDCAKFEAEASCGSAPCLRIARPNFVNRDATLVDRRVSPVLRRSIIGRLTMFTYARGEARAS